MRTTHLHAMLAVGFGAALTSLALMPGCRTVDCGEGTVERSGLCVPPEDVINPARCGDFTELVGDVCVPLFPPTVCEDPNSAEYDPTTGVTTCTGGTSGCDGIFACSQPEAGKQTICGQIYNFETGERFQGPEPTGAACDLNAPTDSGPCALKLRTYSATEFAMNPGGATELEVGSYYLDNCGRYRVSNITVPSGPVLAVALDDAAPANAGAAGLTNITGASTTRTANTVVRDLELYVAPSSMTSKWVADGGPNIATTGLFALIFRAGKTGLANRSGVTVTLRGDPVPDRDFYFVAAETTRTTIDPAATVTGANGTGILNLASANDLTTYSGNAASLPDGCRWSTHPGVTIPGIMLVQVLRPLDVSASEPCSL